MPGSGDDRGGGAVMRKTLLASASVLALSYPAAQAAPPAPMTWTGFYIGANAGYAWGNANVTQIVPFGPPPTAQPPGLRTTGFIGGGQAGYNWQTGQWVIGGEVDFSGLDAKADATVSPFFSSKGASSGSWSSRYDWLFTARARGGFTVAPNWLLYVTGGLAVTHVRDSATILDPPGTPSVFAQSSTLTGGTIGGGVETMFAPNWSARVEYLYAKFKDTSPPFNGTLAIPAVFSFHHDLNVVRFAINYKFGP
jgi:outer membrane immunogenic protein